MLTSPQKRLLAEADIDKRGAERQATSGDAEAQSRDLINKMRSGELAQRQVELLSRLGYEPAQQLIPTKSYTDLKDLLRWVGQFGDTVATRIAIICARAALPAFEAESPDDDRPRKAIEAIENGADGMVLRDASNDANSAAFDVSAFEPGYARYAAFTAYFASFTAHSIQNRLGLVVQYAVKAGVKNTYELIQQELIKWVLDD